MSKQADKQLTLQHNKILAKAARSIGRMSLNPYEIEILLFHETFETEMRSISFHTHKHYELSIMKTGAMKYRTETGYLEISSKDRNLFMMPPFSTHGRKPAKTPSCITGFALLVAADPRRKNLIRDFNNRIFENKFCFSADDELFAVFEKLNFEISAAQPLRNLRISLLIQEFIVIFFRKHFGDLLAEDERDSAQEDIILELIKSYVSENISREIALSDIANYCGFSIRHANRMFRNAAGVSLGKYIIEAKMQTASERLLQSCKLIKTVASELGYDDVSYFSRLFKKHFNVSPEKWRTTKQNEREIESA